MYAVSRMFTPPHGLIGGVECPPSGRSRHQQVGRRATASRRVPFDATRIGWRRAVAAGVPGHPAANMRSICAQRRERRGSGGMEQLLRQAGAPYSAMTGALALLTKVARARLARVGPVLHLRGATAARGASRMMVGGEPRGLLQRAFPAETEIGRGRSGPAAAAGAGAEAFVGTAGGPDPVLSDDLDDAHAPGLGVAVAVFVGGLHPVDDASSARPARWQDVGLTGQDRPMCRLRLSWLDTPNQKLGRRSGRSGPALLVGSHGGDGLRGLRASMLSGGYDQPSSQTSARACAMKAPGSDPGSAAAQNRRGEAIIGDCFSTTRPLPADHKPRTLSSL